ncbi:lysozyme inhibitor LprI family protein [Pseudomonas sp. PIC25]|uniref:lysozyme inhibitor LprI family protein n=1 Tax=Pseudomonas sp. PIC25 TaxID=1958773 RepID=UPI00143D338F
MAQAVNECFDLDDVQVNLCVEHFYTQSTKEFDFVVMSVRKRLKQDIELFDDVQEKWVAFRSSECAVRSIGARAFRDAEAQRQLLIKACAVELNNERIIQLKKVQLECDSCLQ